MRKLYFTAGSPYARTVRIVLVEKGLAFDRVVSPSLEERASATPTLQVPALIDGDVRLWDSAVIVDYLMATYPNAAGGLDPFAADYIRPGHELRDKLVHATVQTFGDSTTTISQLHWTGVPYDTNAHLERCALRNQELLNWFESQLVDENNGFVAGVVSVQDVLLACVCQFIERRPLGITWDSPERPKVRSLVGRLSRRPSFLAEPALWWEPGMDLTNPEQLEWASRTTIADGVDFPAWRASRSQ